MLATVLSLTSGVLVVLTSFSLVFGNEYTELDGDDDAELKSPPSGNICSDFVVTQFSVGAVSLADDNALLVISSENCFNACM